MRPDFSTLLAVLLCTACDAGPDRNHEVARPATAESPHVGEATTLCVDTSGSVVRWRGTERVGDGHHGEVRLADGYVTHEDGRVLDASFTVDMTSITVTDMPAHEVTARRTLIRHLTHEEFFAVDRFPVASFELSDAIRKGQGRYELRGRLTIRDSVHTVRLQAEVPVITDDRLRATAPLTFDRYRWGVRFDGATSMLRNAMVDDDVQLEVELLAGRDLCGTPAPPTARQREPVIGGRCEGCEGVFEGLPDPVPQVGRIAPRGEPGESMRIEGVVRDAADRPAEGVIVYAYQTDAAGVYPEMADPPGPWAARHGRLRAWSRTDAEGRYRFETIRPGPYPGRAAPRHIHMHVIEPGCCTYWIDDIVFTDDPRLTQGMRREVVHGRGGSGVVTPVRDGEDVWRVRRDVRLGQGVRD